MSAGARGVRFNAVSGNGTPLDQLESLAARVAPLGWHIQFYTHGEQIADLAPVIRKLPVDRGARSHGGRAERSWHSKPGIPRRRRA